jgi:hypothetical protein
MVKKLLFVPIAKIRVIRSADWGHNIHVISVKKLARLNVVVHNFYKCIVDHIDYMVLYAVNL